MTDRNIDEAILKLTRQRGPEKTVCPSEVARYLVADDWRPLMEPIRERARFLAGKGKIEITQAAAVVDPTTEWRGPIRLRYRK